MQNNEQFDMQRRMAGEIMQNNKEFVETYDLPVEIDPAKLRPINGRVILECLNTDIDALSRVIYIPEQYSQDTQICRIISLSAEATRELSPAIRAGSDVLLRRKDTGFRLEHNGRKYINTTWRCIIAGIEYSDN